MTTHCPKGHASDDADYCSECGARIAPPGHVAQTAAAGFAPASAPRDSSNPGDCPDCGTPRLNGARFCEVCRHDFQGTDVFYAPLKSVPAASPSPSLSPSPQPLAAPITTPFHATATPTTTLSAMETAVAVAQKLSVVVITDPSLVTEPDPENPCPVNAPERVFPLDLAENLLGRRSVSKDSHPEIPVNDPGVSRRHLKFLRQPDGSFQVVDLGSANGLHFNNRILEPGVQTPVRAGDEIRVGMWTRLLIRAR